MTNQTTEMQKRERDEAIERTRDQQVYIPPVDIYEKSDAIVLVADMPGVNESSVDITLEKNVLTIEGFVKPQNPEGYDLGWSEYGIGDYKRSFTLSEEIDREKIEASVKDGVLRVTLGKAEPAVTKKIKVKAA